MKEKKTSKRVSRELGDRPRVDFQVDSNLAKVFLRWPKRRHAIASNAIVEPPPKDPLSDFPKGRKGIFCARRVTSRPEIYIYLCPSMWTKSDTPACVFTLSQRSRRYSPRKATRKGDCHAHTPRLGIFTKSTKATDTGRAQDQERLSPAFHQKPTDFFSKGRENRYRVAFRGVRSSRSHRSCARIQIAIPMRVHTPFERREYRRRDWRKRATERGTPHLLSLSLSLETLSLSRERERERRATADTAPRSRRATALKRPLSPNSSLSLSLSLSRGGVLFPPLSRVRERERDALRRPRV